jgi:hypothetical protein
VATTAAAKGSLTGVVSAEGSQTVTPVDDPDEPVSRISSPPTTPRMNDQPTGTSYLRTGSPVSLVSSPSSSRPPDLAGWNVQNVSSVAAGKRSCT